MQRAKYNAKKIVTPDGSFDSKKEYLRFCELKIQETDGEIKDLQRQTEFTLIPTQKLQGGTLRSVKYVADFTYKKGDQLIVEDVKPTDKAGNVSKSYKRTQAWKEYMIKKKLMAFIKGIEVREV